MRVRNEYDLIVVGDQLAGFFLAAGAAQAGFEVLVIEGTIVPTALYELPSGRFLTDLICEPLLGLSAASKEDEFLKSLGLYSELGELFPAFSPPLQVITPKWRVDYSYEAKDLEREFARELGISVDSLVKLLAAQTVSKKHFIDVAADLKLPVEWEKLGALQLALYGSAEPAEIPYSAYKKVVDLAKRGGVRYAIGGRSALKERLSSRIQVYNGTIKRNAWVEEIVFEHNRLTGVLLSTYEGFVKSPIIVGSMKAKTFLDLVPTNIRPKRLVDSVSDIEAKYWRMSFNVVIPQDAIPEGLAEHFAYFTPDADLQEDYFFQAQLLPKGVYSGIPAGHQSLLVRFLVPLNEKSLSPLYIQRLMRRILAKLEEFMPSLRKKAISITPDPEHLESDPVYQKWFQFESIERIPPAFLVYNHTLDNSLTSTAFMDWSEFGLDGLALCSRDMDPLLGLMGEIRSAMDLLHLLKAKRAKQLKKQS